MKKAEIRAGTTHSRSESRNNDYASADFLQVFLIHKEFFWFIVRQHLTGFDLQLSYTASTICVITVLLCHLGISQEFQIKFPFVVVQKRMI